MAVFRFGLLGCLLMGACDFGINTTGLAGEGGLVPDTGSDAFVPPDDAGDESTPPDETSTGDTGATYLFGDTNVESSQDNVSLNDPDGFRYQAIAGGSAQTVWVYVDSQNGTTFDVGIYDDNAATTPAQPKGLLAFTTFTTPSSGWQQQSLNQSITITQGSFYWIVLHPTSGTVFYRDKGGSSGSVENVSANTATLPTTWTSVNDSLDGPASMYVTP
jgi:hypothetical protein